MELGNGSSWQAYVHENSYYLLVTACMTAVTACMTAAVSTREVTLACCFKEEKSVSRATFLIA